MRWRHCKEDDNREFMVHRNWPIEQPSMSRVVEMLEGSSDSLQIPPKPYLSSPPRSPLGSFTVMLSLQ